MVGLVGGGCSSAMVMKVANQYFAKQSECTYDGKTTLQLSETLWY